MRYLVDCKHYPGPRCESPKSICLFRSVGGLGCRNIKIDWVEFVTLRQHIKNIREWIEK